MSSTREAYGSLLVEFAEEYDFFVFDADLSKATQTVHFSKKYPERFCNMGIAEANMMGYAAGFATCGTKVIASTFAMFAAGRAYEQIRNSIAYPNMNVIVAATHGGVLIGADGGSHQCIEDIALMRAIPNMTVLYPADTIETKKCMQAALEHDGPVYLRFGRAETPELYTEMQQCSFEIGKGTLLRDGTDIAIIAVGDMVHRAVCAAEELSKRSISAAVIDMASIKPIDRKLVSSYAIKTRCIVTAEDHNVIGGLADAVAEVLGGECPVVLKRVGVQDRFGQSGTPDELEHEYKIAAVNIVNAAIDAIGRKAMTK